MSQCNIVRDLIPLYVEGLTNEDSCVLVEQHIAQCSECKSYYEMIQQDYEKQMSQEPELDQRKLDNLVTKLAKYQQNIKLFGVLVAMLMACIITGAGVQFLSTIPFLLITPFVCRLYYNKSLPILLSSIPFGVIGSMLSEQNASYIPFFTVVSFIFALIGVGLGYMVKLALKQLKSFLKWLYLLPVIVIILFSSSAYFSFYGNPVGYLEAMMKTRSYVNQQYEPGTLAFKGVIYNFKDHRHYGKFEYVLNGTRQHATIGFDRNGEIDDHYKYMLEMQFCDERSADLKVEIAAAIDYAPVTIFAKPEAELQITEDEINSRYYHLSYDPAKQNKATALRQSESGKLHYEIAFGPFSGQYDAMSKETFMNKATAMLNALKNRSVPFKQIEVKAMDNSGQLQSVSFYPDTTAQELMNSYQSSK